MNYNTALLTTLLAAFSNAKEVASYCDLIAHDELTLKYQLNDDLVSGQTYKTLDISGLAPGKVVVGRHVDSCASGVAAQVAPLTATINRNGFFNLEAVEATSGASYSAESVLNGGAIGGL